jgi:hypothetical protein
MGKYATRKSVRMKKPKTKLGLPDLDHGKAAVLESLHIAPRECRLPGTARCRSNAMSYAARA